MLHGAKEGAPHLYSLLLCAVRTGMRQGELIALQWSDIDFRGQFIEIRRTWRRGRLSDTKNHKIRRVELSPQLLDHLRELYDTQQLEASMSGNRAPEWVFVTPSRTRYDDSNLRLSFNHVLMRAGIRRVRFHDLRHTYASLMAEAGAPPKYVQEQLGHSSIQVTMDVYSHLFPSGNRNWLKHLDEGRENKDSAPLAHPTLPHHPLWL